MMKFEEACKAMKDQKVVYRTFTDLHVQSIISGRITSIDPGGKCRLEYQHEGSRRTTLVTLDTLHLTHADAIKALTDVPF